MWQVRRRGAGAGGGAHTVKCVWQHHSSRGLTLSIPCCFVDMGETVSQARGFVVQPGQVFCAWRDDVAAGGRGFRQHQVVMGEHSVAASLAEHSKLLC